MTIENLTAQSTFLKSICHQLYEARSNYHLLGLIEAGMSLQGMTSNMVSALSKYPVLQWAMVPRREKDLIELAPYLIDLSFIEADKDEAITTFSEWLFKQKSLSTWGLFIISDNSFSEILPTLRSFLYIHFEKQRSYFRYFHPRFFDSFWKDLGEKDKCKFLEYVGIVFYFDFYNSEIIHFSSIVNGDLRDVAFNLDNNITKELSNLLIEKKVISKKKDASHG